MLEVHAIGTIADVGRPFLVKDDKGNPDYHIVSAQLRGRLLVGSAGLAASAGVEPAPEVSEWVDYGEISDLEIVATCPYEEQRDLYDQVVALKLRQKVRAIFNLFYRLPYGSGGRGRARKILTLQLERVEILADAEPLDFSGLGSPAAAARGGRAGRAVQSHAE